MLLGGSVTRSMSGEVMRAATYPATTLPRTATSARGMARPGENDVATAAAMARR